MFQTGQVSSLLVQNYHFEVARSKKYEFSPLNLSPTELDSNFFFRAACITRLRIDNQLENHRKELFPTELQWEIFCCITSPESNIAERNVGISRCTDFVFLSISILF